MFHTNRNSTHFYTQHHTQLCLIPTEAIICDIWLTVVHLCKTKVNKKNVDMLIILLFITHYGSGIIYRHLFNINVHLLKVIYLLWAIAY